MSKHKTILILSGGGSWNSFVAGWLQQNLSIINPDIIIGSSGGALLASSIMSDIDICSENLWKKLSQNAIKFSRLFSDKIIDTQFLINSSTNSNYELINSPIELIVPVTNNNGDIDYFSSKKNNPDIFLKALEATCSIPIQ